MNDSEEEEEERGDQTLCELMMELNMSLNIPFAHEGPILCLQVPEEDMGSLEFKRTGRKILPHELIGHQKGIDRQGIFVTGSVDKTVKVWRWVITNDDDMNPFNRQSNNKPKIYTTYGVVRA